MECKVWMEGQQKYESLANRARTAQDSTLLLGEIGNLCRIHCVKY